MPVVPLLDAEQLLQRVDGEVHEEERRAAEEQPVDLADLAEARLDDHVGDEAGADAVGDGVGERHDGDGQEGRDGEFVAVPVDVPDLRHHQEPDHDERRGRRLERHERQDGREEEGQTEQAAGDHAGEAGARTLTDARGGFDVGGGGRGGGGAAGHGGRTVDEQDAAETGDLAALVEQPGFGGDADDRAHRVEEVGQDEGEDQQDDGQDAGLAERAEHVELADEPEVRCGDGIAGQRRSGHTPVLHLGELVDHDRDERHQDDADEDRALDPAGDEHDRHQHAEAEDENRPAGERAVAELDRHGGLRGVRDAGDEAGVDEADERDEQADADADRLLERLWDRVHDGLAETRHDQHADQQALEHDEAHRVFPGHERGDLHRDDDVDAEARREGEGQVAAHTHDERHHACHQGGGGGQLGAVELVAELVLRVAEDDRVEHEDVRHGEERGEPTAYLPVERRPAFADAEEAVERAARSVGRRLGRARRAGLHDCVSWTYG